MHPSHSKNGKRSCFGLFMNKGVAPLSECYRGRTWEPFLNSICTFQKSSHTIQTPDSDARVCCAQTYSATETQLMRRNGDIEHVRRSRRAGAQSPSVSHEGRAADRDTDADSDSSEGAAAAHRDALESDKQSSPAAGLQQKGDVIKGGKKIRSGGVMAGALEDRAKAPVQQRKKKRKSGEAAEIGKGPASIPRSARKAARTKTNDKPLQQ